MKAVERQQQAICDRHGADFDPSQTGSRVGIALRTLVRRPLNGLRVAPDGVACGWYLWGGKEWSDDPDFFQPLCVEHVAERCPAALQFFRLPAGWQFLIDSSFNDVWYDPQLLKRLS